MLGVYYILSIIGMTMAIGFILYLAISYRSYRKHRMYRSEKEECITSLLFAYDTEMISLGEIIYKQTFVNRVLVLDWLDQITKISPLRFLNLNDVFVSSGNKLTADIPIEHLQTGVFAAPEEFPTRDANIRRYCWLHDEREDVFRVGLIFSELNSIAYGEISDGYGKIINRCLEIDPAKRYRNLRKLRSDLHRLEGSKYKAQQVVIRRRAIYTLVFIMIIVSHASFIIGYTSSFRTPTLVMSINGYAPLMIEKKTALGNTEWIDSNIRIISDPDFRTVAVNDGLVQGMYEGTTVLNGLYRRVIPISINVLVTQPQTTPFSYAMIEDEVVRVSQYFREHSRVEVFAGDREALITDDILPVSDATFASPESMAVDVNGIVYASDGNALRIIQDGYVKQADLQQYIPHVLRSIEDELYILTRPYWFEESRYIAIIKWNGNNMEKIYERYAPYGDVATDFIIDDRENIYLLLYNRFYSETELLKLSNEHEFLEPLYTIPFYASSMDKHSDSQFFISAPYRGEILLFDVRTQEMKVIAGCYDEKGIIDGRDGRLYFPHRIRWHSNRLLVWDSNVLRQINIVNSEFDIIISLAGVVSSEQGDGIEGIHDAHDIVFPFSRNADIVVLGENILISDPRNRVIWMVSAGDRAIDVS